MSLSEREQRLLEEIERSLMADDPQVPSKGRMGRPKALLGIPGAAAAIATVIGLGFLILGLVTGAVLGTVIATAGLVLIVVGCCEIDTCRRR